MKAPEIIAEPPCAVPTNPATVVSNIGKARKRWKAMARIGMSVVFSTQKQLVPLAGIEPVASESTTRRPNH